MPRPASAFALLFLFIALLLPEISLLTYRLLMDCSKNITHKFSRQAKSRCHCHTLLHKLVIAVGLYYRYTTCMLIAPDVARHLHTTGKKLKKFVVNTVDLLPEYVEFFLMLLVGRHHKRRQYLCQPGWRNLLRRITQRRRRVTVTLYDEPVETQVESLLRDRLYQVGAAAYVARVANQWKLRKSAVKLYRHSPLRRIAVETRAIMAEPAVHGAKPLNSGGVDALQGSYPQLKVGIDRIFYQHGKTVATLGRQSRKRIGNLLHCKRIGRRTRPYPHHINTGFNSLGKMPGGGHLSGHKHTRLLLHLAEPRQSRTAYTLKASGMCTRLPYSGTEDFYPYCRKPMCRGKCLLAALGAARPRQYQRRRAHYILAEKWCESHVY